MKMKLKNICLVSLLCVAIPIPSWANNNFVSGGGGSGVSPTKWRILNSSGVPVTAVGTLAQQRAFHCSVALNNGNVFLAGGNVAASLNSWEIRNSSGGLVATGQLTMKRGIGHTCSLLNNGNIMIVGGNLFANPLEFPPDVEELGDKDDPENLPSPFPEPPEDNPAGSWEIRNSVGVLQREGLLSVNRLRHTTTVLTNGNVFIAGGDGSSQTWELRDDNGDLISSSFTTGNNLVTARTFHCAVALPNGRAFLAAGSGLGSATWEIRGSNGFLVPGLNGSLTVSRGFDPTCSKLQDNKIFIAGGANHAGSWEVLSETGTPVRNNFGGPLGMGANRTQHAAQVQSDTGNILLIGGLFSPGNGTWELHIGSGPNVGDLSTQGTIDAAFIGPNGPGISAVEFKNPDLAAPVLSTGQPTGTLPAGATQVTLSVTTNENATCRYSMTPGVAYSAMTNGFSATGSTAHSTLITGLTAQSYSFYLRCQDTAGNANTTDFPVSFSVSGQLVGGGGRHTCARLGNGTMKCWGFNNYGALGNGTITSYSAVPVSVAGITTATFVEGQGDNHSCVVLANGTIQCWGRNSWGQLGNGTTTNSTTPVTVSGITTATAVTAGPGHTCARLSNGTVKCWGLNLNGELGIGTTTNSSTPVAVSGITTATAISTLSFHTCVVLADGTIKCWGYNASGQLGNGTTIDSTMPVTVSGITTATSVSAGGAHTCARLSNGSVKCWGDNFDGRLGDGTTTNSTMPVTVSGISTATTVKASGYHTCALLDAKTISCWGYNASGQLGNGATTNSTTPVTVSGITTATSLGVGGGHTCASLDAGIIQCWGWNYFGQLGNGTTTDASTPVPVSGIP